jgi:hypothetical protein
LGKNIKLKFPELLPKLLVKRASKKQKWSECLTSLTSIFITLRQNRNFTDSEVDILQKQMDKWTRNWIELNNKEGINNYTHIMASKHGTYFLKRYINLYRCSNQGWDFQIKQVSKHKAIMFEEIMNAQRNLFNLHNLYIYNISYIRYIYHHRTQNKTKVIRGLVAVAV